jgi:hypothetical protein
VPTAGGLQVPFAQHPLGHDAASQAQAPETQLAPAPQAEFAPQRHSPVAEQLSAR